MSANAIDLLRPHERDLGGFTVRRLLPAGLRKTVGPFIFFDHMGPADFAPGSGIDVRPHPHIGLATVTWLFDGALMHRDSVGSVQRIVPGEVNWMTAGRGIVHSERSPAHERAAGHRLHGIQTWVALPQADEAGAPTFAHVAAETLPRIALPGADIRVIAGTAWGERAPTPTCSATLYCAVQLDAGATLEIDTEHRERAVYAVDAALELDGAPLPALHMARLPEGRAVLVRAAQPARLMLLGGAPLDGERFIWWNFVASSRAAIEDAKARWRAQRFDPVPGETEFVPLPE